MAKKSVKDQVAEAINLSLPKLISGYDLHSTKLVCPRCRAGLRNVVGTELLVCTLPGCKLQHVILNNEAFNELHAVYGNNKTVVKLKELIDLAKEVWNGIIYPT